MANCKYLIEDHELDYDNDGPFLSLRLDTEGDTFEEMVENATITAVDQDGGDRWQEKAFGYSHSIDDQCELALAEEIIRFHQEKARLKKEQRQMMCKIHLTDEGTNDGVCVSCGLDLLSNNGLRLLQEQDAANRTMSQVTAAAVTERLKGDWK